MRDVNRAGLLTLELARLLHGAGATGKALLVFRLPLAGKIIAMQQRIQVRSPQEDRQQPTGPLAKRSVAPGRRARARLGGRAGGEAEDAARRGRIGPLSSVTRWGTMC